MRVEQTSATASHPIRCLLFTISRNYDYGRHHTLACNVMLNFVISFFLIFVWFAFSMPAKRLAHFHTHASIFFWILFDSQSFKYDFQVQMHKWPCFVLDCIFHISFSAIFFPIWFNSKFISLWMSIYNFYLLLSFLLPNTCLLR